MKTTFLAAILTMAGWHAHAQKSEVFAPEGKALKGYDAVAFFRDTGPVKGADSLSFSYKGVDWLFANQAHLDAFRANPEAYVPQYGGYCAYGTSEGHKAPTEAETWTIVDNKLYFNYSRKVQKAWLKNRGERIRQADTQWPLIKDKP